MWPFRTWFGWGPPLYEAPRKRRNMAQPSRNDVLAALDQVIDPVTGRSVVQQDMIQGLVVRDGHVGFALEVAAGRGREAEPLRAEVEAAARAVPGVLSVTAVLTAHEEGPSA